MEIESNMAKGKEKTIYVLEYCPSEGSDPLKEWNVTQRHEHPALAPHSGGKQKVSTAAGDVELRVPPLAERNYKILGWASQRIEQLHRHLVVVHDPTSTIGPRYNLAEGIDNVSDARAIADVLVPSAQGDNKFWTDSAAALLAACLIRFDNLGDIYNAMNDLKALAQSLSSKKDDASLLANSFIASVGSDGKVASNVVATLATALTGWASTEVR